MEETYPEMLELPKDTEKKHAVWSLMEEMEFSDEPLEVLLEEYGITMEDYLKHKDSFL